MAIEQDNILLTIAVPTYNRKKLLKRALDSIIPQLNPKIEILVSDNASDDGTDKMIAEFFPMVRYIKNNTNIGADANFLQCYRKARGKYVILLGSDDRFAANALNYLTDFLEKHKCDLVFLNYGRYDINSKAVYIKDSEHIKNYSTKQDIITTNKSLFMKYVNHGITFMSALIAKRSLIMDVKNPEQFIGSYFLHTNIMLESIKAPKSFLGVIMRPLIEANATVGDSEMSKMPEETFTVVGNHMYSTLCIHAVKCGFQKECMRKVYLQYLHDYPFWKVILSIRGKKNKEAMENYWRDGNWVLKKYPFEWIKSMIATFMPQFIVSWLYRIYHILRKKV